MVNTSTENCETGAVLHSSSAVVAATFNPQWLSAGAAVTTATVALVALALGLVQIRQARAARTLLQDLQIQQSQPYIVMFLEPSRATPFVMDLVIRNFGATAGRDVTCSIDPWPTRSPQPGVGEQYERVAIPNPIPFLAPGQEWRTMWDTGHRLSTDMVPRHQAEVTYTGINSVQLHSRSVLDWDVEATRLWSETKTVHDVAKSLLKLEELAHKWTDGSRGLKVMARDGAAYDRAQRQHRDRLLGQQKGAPRRKARMKRRTAG